MLPCGSSNLIKSHIWYLHRRLHRSQVSLWYLDEKLNIFNYLTIFFLFHSYNCRYFGGGYGTLLQRLRVRRRAKTIGDPRCYPVNFDLPMPPYKWFWRLEFNRWVACPWTRPYTITALYEASRDSLTVLTGGGSGICVVRKKAFYSGSNIRLDCQYCILGKSVERNILLPCPSSITSHVLLSHVTFLATWLGLV